MNRDLELLIAFLRPIEELLRDDSVTEIMGNPDGSWWFERAGRLHHADAVAFEARALRTGLEVIASRMGRKLDDAHPLLNVQLPDGSRLAAVLPPIVRPAPSVTVRKFASSRYTLSDLVERGAMPHECAEHLTAEVWAGHTMLISGGTGSGKTTTLAAIREAAERQGYAVEGFAPTSKAASQLRDAGISADTLQGFLVRGGQQQTAGDSASRHLYMVDESSLASTRQMRDFLDKVNPQDRVLVIGDVRQHHGVEAGKPFEQMQDAGMRTSVLDRIVRQQDPGLLTAVEHLSRNETAVGIDLLQKQGRVTEIPDAQARIAAIARDYAAKPEGTLIVSPDNASRREINRAVRSELQQSGLVSRDSHSLPTLIPRNDLTGADRQWAARYNVGEVIYYNRGSQDLELPKGAYATVTRVDASENRLTVCREDGVALTYDPRRLQGVSVYQEIHRDFARGDRLQFTAPVRELGVSNRDLGTVQKIVDGRVTVQVDGPNPRTVTFDANRMRHIDHGYAVTSHSAQGITAERVLVNMDTRAPAELISTRFAYVAVSRASQEVRIYTNDVSNLGERIGREVNKASAVDFEPRASRQEQSMGMSLGL